MKRLLHAAFLVAATGAGPADAGLEDFGWFAQMSGTCWTGTLPDGTTRHTHCYTTQFDRFVRGVAQLKGGHSGQSLADFAGDSVFAWDAERARIVYYIWGSDGSHGRYEAYYEGTDLVFPIESKRQPGTWAYRSAWHRENEDTLEVRREVPDGETWRTELTVTYQRQPAAAARPAE